MRVAPAAMPLMSSPLGPDPVPAVSLRPLAAILSLELKMEFLCLLAPEVTQPHEV